MKIPKFELDREHLMILALSGVAIFVVFLVWRRAHLAALAARARSETVDFVNGAAANSPPPGSDFTQGRVVPLFPGSASE
jgi:hypothetical protein